MKMKLTPVPMAFDPFNNSFGAITIAPTALHVSRCRFMSKDSGLYVLRRPYHWPIERYAAPAIFF